jgi:hypothetical protein
MGQPAKQAKKTLKNPLKAGRDLTGMTKAKREAEEAMRKQQEAMDKQAAEAEKAAVAAAMPDPLKAVSASEQAQQKAYRRRQGGGIRTSSRGILGGSSTATKKLGS